jgi:putative heme-binding domain-containing protein
VFAKHCQECHTLFGVGGKTGPDLTKSKREDLDFLVTSVVDPSAEFAKGFEPWLVVTTSGRIINGIVKEPDADPITVQVVGQKVIVPRSEIEDMQPSKVSIMPTELLKPFDDHEVRSLFAYLSGRGQVPMLAREETAVFFAAYGPDLNCWQRGGGAWQVDQGEIVAAGPEAGEPPLLLSEMVLRDDFRVTLRFHPGKDGRGAVLLRGEDKNAQTWARVEFAAGAAVGLSGADGVRATAEPGSAAESNRVQADAWNRLEVSVVGQRLQVRLNSKAAAVLPDTKFSGRRAIALEGPSRAGQEIRFGHLELRLLAAEKQ